MIVVGGERYPVSPSGVAGWVLNLREAPATRPPHSSINSAAWPGACPLMLDNPDSRAIPRNLRSFGGQAGNEAEQVQRYLLGDVWRYQRGNAARQAISSPVTPGSMSKANATPKPSSHWPGAWSMSSGHCYVINESSRSSPREPWPPSLLDRQA